MQHFAVSERLVRFISMLPLFIVSVTIHEFAHARVAQHFGDFTAKKAGRSTFNPLKHIDLVGTILMPLVSFASGFALLGWAKPVPVDRSNFKDPLKNDMYVSLAGPVSNFLLALLFLVLLILMKAFHIILPQMSYQIFIYSIYFNVFLCLFNLLPIPPLDGSHVIFDLFPNEHTAKLQRFGLYGSLFILIIINTPLFDYFLHLVYYVTTLLMKVYTAF